MLVRIKDAGTSMQLAKLQCVCVGGGGGGEGVAAGFTHCLLVWGHAPQGKFETLMFWWSVCFLLFINLYS